MCVLRWDLSFTLLLLSVIGDVYTCLSFLSWRRLQFVVISIFCHLNILVYLKFCLWFILLTFALSHRFVRSCRFSFLGLFFIVVFFIFDVVFTFLSFILSSFIWFDVSLSFAILEFLCSCRLNLFQFTLSRLYRRFLFFFDKSFSILLSKEIVFHSCILFLSVTLSQFVAFYLFFQCPRSLLVLFFISFVV